MVRKTPREIRLIFKFPHGVEYQHFYYWRHLLYKPIYYISHINKKFQILCWMFLNLNLNVDNPKWLIKNANPLLETFEHLMCLSVCVEIFYMSCCCCCCFSCCPLELFNWKQILYCFNYMSSLNQIISVISFSFSFSNAKRRCIFSWINCWFCNWIFVYSFTVKVKWH